eukprot:1159176-Pelagomonas_calceolata.AAC.1
MEAVLFMFTAKFTPAAKQMMRNTCHGLMEFSRLRFSVNLAPDFFAATCPRYVRQSDVCATPHYPEKHKQHIQEGDYAVARFQANEANNGMADTGIPVAGPGENPLSRISCSQ